MLLRSAICFSSAAERDFTQLGLEGAMPSSSDALWTIGGDERGLIVAREAQHPPSVLFTLQQPSSISSSDFACFFGTEFKISLRLGLLVMPFDLLPL